MNANNLNKKTKGIDEEFDKYVEYRLKEWALWFASEKSYNLGYPSSTIVHRMMTEGIIEKQIGAVPLSCNEDAEEIESLVSEMNERNERLASALRIHYFGQRKSRDRSLEIAATLFRNYVGMARQWIAGRLSSGYRFL